MRTLGLRFCRSSTVLYYECDDKLVVRSANVAASVASEARSLITDGLSKDMLQINALVKCSADLRAGRKVKRKEDELQKGVRRHFESVMIDEWLASRGLMFCENGRYNLDPDAIGFIEDALAKGVAPFSPDGFREQAKDWMKMGWICKVDPDSDPEFDLCPSEGFQAQPCDSPFCSEVTALKCPKNHALLPIVAPSSSACDRCDQDVFAGSPVWECFSCNYWLCARCMAAATDSPDVVHTEATTSSAELPKSTVVTGLSVSLECID